MLRGAPVLGEKARLSKPRFGTEVRLGPVLLPPLFVPLYFEFIFPLRLLYFYPFPCFLPFSS